jgi:membrane protein
MAKPNEPHPALLGLMALAGFLIEPVERRLAGVRAAAAARPQRNWWQVLKRAANGFNEDRVMAEAAGVTFYVLLALFPAIASLISIYGLFASTQHLSDNLAELRGIIPDGGLQIIETQVQALTSSPPQALGFGVVVGLATSLWSANAGVKAFFGALNVVYHEREKRGFFHLTLISFSFTFGLIGFLMLALAAVVVVPIMLNFVGLGSFGGRMLAFARWPLMVMVMGGALSLLYRYGPSPRNARWKWVSWGSAFAAIAWVAASLGFSYYVANFGSYNKTYGSLGAVVGFMTWIWVSAMVVLVGAELDAALEAKEGAA